MASKNELEEKRQGARQDPSLPQQKPEATNVPRDGNRDTSQPGTRGQHPEHKLAWREDGDEQWVANLGAGRQARIQKLGDGFHARKLGDDPSATNMGTFPSLDAAKEAFSHDVTAVAHSQEAKDAAVEVATAAAVSGDVNRPERA